MAADSPFQTVDDVIAAGMERTLSVATSRLPHPASIGALLLAEHTGAQFNLIPLSGGRNTLAGVVTGETDFGVLPSGSVASAGESVRTLALWDDTNPMPEKLNNAPTINQHFGTSFPALVSARAFGIHTQGHRGSSGTLRVSFLDREAGVRRPGMARGCCSGWPAASN